MSTSSSSSIPVASSTSSAALCSGFTPHAYLPLQCRECGLAKSAHSHSSLQSAATYNQLYTSNHLVNNAQHLPAHPSLSAAASRVQLQQQQQQQQGPNASLPPGPPPI